MICIYQCYNYGMYDDETFDIYVRNSERKVLKGRIDLEPYTRLYFLLYRRPDLETTIGDKLTEAARIYEAEIDEYVDDVTQRVAYENDIEIPILPEAPTEEVRWQMGWDKVREYEWKKQQGAHA